MALKLGTFLPQNWSHDPHGSLVEAARAAEKIGYDSVWVFERVLYAEDQTGVHRLTEYGDGAWPDIYRRVIDPVVALSMAVAVTSRVRVGTAALIPPLHVPARALVRVGRGGQRWAGRCGAWHWLVG